MKTIRVSLILLILVLCVNLEAVSQTNYQVVADHFYESWSSKAVDWEKTRNLQYVVYLVSALLSIVSGVLHTMKKGVAWVAVCLSTLVALSTQVSWLFNVQPKKYEYAVKKITTDLRNFKDSLFGQDLSNPSIGAVYLDQQQKLEAKFLKIEQWLIEEQVEVPTNGSSGYIKSTEAFSPVFASLTSPEEGPQCLEAQFDFSKSKTIRAGSFTAELPDHLINQIQSDKSGIYFVGFCAASDASVAASGADDCTIQSMTKFMAGNNQVAQQNAGQVARKLFDLSESVLLKFYSQPNQIACLKITRIQKTLIDSYFTNFNLLKLKSPQLINKEFKTKLKKSEAIY